MESSIAITCYKLSYVHLLLDHTWSSNTNKHSIEHDSQINFSSVGPTNIKINKTWYGMTLKGCPLPALHYAVTFPSGLPQHVAARCGTVFHWKLNSKMPSCCMKQKLNKNKHFNISFVNCNERGTLSPGHIILLPVSKSWGITTFSCWCA